MADKSHKCGFWKGHKWGQWHILNDGKAMPITRTTDNSVVGHSFIQQRICEACGLSQFKTDTVISV